MSGASAQSQVREGEVKELDRKCKLAPHTHTQAGDVEEDGGGEANWVVKCNFMLIQTRDIYFFEARARERRMLLYLHLLSHEKEQW